MLSEFLSYLMAPRHLQNDHFRASEEPFSSSCTRRSEPSSSKSHNNDKVEDASAFLRMGFDKLAEEQLQGLKSIKLQDYDTEGVDTLEAKLCLANRLLIRQCDTRFGVETTNFALMKCGHNWFGFRRRNHCL